MVHLENRLSKHPHYAIIETQVANLKKLQLYLKKLLSLSVAITVHTVKFECGL